MPELRGAPHNAVKSDQRGRAAKASGEVASGENQGERRVASCRRAVEDERWCGRTDNGGEARRRLSRNIDPAGLTRSPLGPGRESPDMIGTAGCNPCPACYGCRELRRQQRSRREAGKAHGKCEVNERAGVRHFIQHTIRYAAIRVRVTDS